jgi:DNA-binding transcriptional ArsR family regulator
MEKPVQLHGALIDMRDHKLLAPVIRIMAHPLRLRILDCLYAVEKPQTVSAITAAAEAPQPIVSQQLGILRGQVVTERSPCGLLPYQRLYATT